MIAVLTAVELTANAAIVQSRVGYTDAYKYHDAVLQLKDAINPIRPDDTDFYRINKTFNLSKTIRLWSITQVYQYLVRTWKIVRVIYLTA